MLGFMNMRNYTMDYLLPGEEDMIANRSVQVMDMGIPYTDSTLIEHLIDDVIPHGAALLLIVEIIGDYSLSELEKVTDLSRIRYVYVDEPLVKKKTSRCNTQ